MIWPSRMRSYSGGSGSFTLTIMSAVAQTSSLLGRILAPAATYSESSNPEPLPASCSTYTSWPALTIAMTPAGVMATRFS